MSLLKQQKLMQKEIGEMKNTLSIQTISSDPKINFMQDNMKKVMENANNLETYLAK